MTGLYILLLEYHNVIAHGFSANGYAFKRNLGLLECERISLNFKVSLFSLFDDCSINSIMQSWLNVQALF